MAQKLNKIGEIILAVIADAGGSWSKGCNALAEEVGIPVDAIKRSLKWLTGNGFLVLTPRHGKSSIYEVSQHESSTPASAPVHQRTPPLKGGGRSVHMVRMAEGDADSDGLPPDDLTYPDIIGVEDVERTPDGEHVHIPPGFVAAPAPEVLDDDGGEWREFQDELNKRRALQRLGVGRKMYDTFSDIMDRHPQTVEVITRLDDPEIVRQQRLEDAQARDRELEEWKKERPPRRSKPDEVVINTYADKDGAPITCCARCGKRGDHKRNMVLDEKERLVCMNEIDCRKELRAKKAALQAEIDVEDRQRAEARARREDA